MDEDVKRVADLVPSLRHGAAPRSRAGAVTARLLSGPRLDTNMCSHDFMMSDSARSRNPADSPTIQPNRTEDRGPGTVRNVRDPAASVESHHRDRPEQLDLHPRADSARFIPRLGQSQQRLRPLLAARGVTIVAAPLYYMQHNPELALFVS